MKPRIVQHLELTKFAYNWLLKFVKCGFALRELKTCSLEIPDAIGWKNGYSVLVECKTSRQDFWLDSKKQHRINEAFGVGDYRFYLCPERMINAEDLPPKWGLLWLMPDDKIKMVHGPTGNVWSNWPRFESNKQAENFMLVSALRRVNKNGDLEELLR